MKKIKLNNGIEMPILGYGVYQISKEEIENAVLNALKIGYRLIDTAQAYENEEKVGSAIKKRTIPREELFITSKVWISHFSYENTKIAFNESLQKLDL